MDAINAFLNSSDVQRSEPATKAEIEEFQAETGLSLTSEIVRLYEQSNGLNIERLFLRFLPLNETKNYIDVFRDWEATANWALFPFTDSNDSNPFCLSCNERLTGRIVHVFHDNDAKIEFQNLESFLASILTSLSSEDVPSIDDLPNQYSDFNNRTPEDITDGMRLVSLANNLPKDDPERDHVLVFATQLLPDANAEALVPLLDGSPWVRRTALDRLIRIPTSEAKAAIAQYRRSFEEFRASAVDSLRKAKIVVEKEKENCVLIQPGHTWLDIGSFYEDRHQVGIFERIVERAAYFITLKSH